MNYSCSKNEKNSISKHIVNLGASLEDRLFFDSESPVRLLLVEGKLAVWTEEMEKSGLKPHSYDLMRKYQQHKSRNYALSREPLYKAVGLKKSTSTTIVDATFGQGNDAMLLLSFGAKIIGYERNPLLAALILSDLHDSQFTDNLEFHYGDVQGLDASGDVLYYDPMYGDQINTKAKPKKEMQVFREIVGKDEDVESFLEWAFKHFSRVVIKRAIRAKELAPNPSISFEGKSTRYDVYLKHHTPQ